MAEVLSQQDIDDILKGGGSFNESKANEKEILPYDFRLPNRISKSQLRTIRNISENFAESFGSYLMTTLQTVVNIRVNTVDQIYYSEYVLSVPDPSVLYTFTIKGTDIRLVLELNIDFALALVDRLLGGSGNSAKPQKVITQIEQKVLSNVIEKIMFDLKKAWMVIDNFEYKLDGFETDIDFVQLSSPNESVLLISFEISIGDQSYLMNLCFTTFAFDPILSKLSTKRVTTIKNSKYYGMTASELIKLQLSEVELPVVVELGQSSISFQELLDLKIGDIIILDNKIHNELKVNVNDKLAYYAHPGIVNNHKAIRITKNLLTNISI
jgi:flagellar motor switch protein FliM